MLFVFGFIALLTLVGVVLLIRFIAGGGGPRTLLWAVLVVFAVIIAGMLLQIATIYYKVPFGWAVAVAAAILVVIALLVRIGMDVAWKAPRVLALVGLLVASLITLTIAMIGVPIGGLFVPMFEARAQQIVEEDGFVVLVAHDEKLSLDSMPIDQPEDKNGVTLWYERFTLLERKADGPLDYADLAKLVPVGKEPLGYDGPGIPADARYAEFRVSINPALGVEYEATPLEKAVSDPSTDLMRVLVFERDGVEVRIVSQGGMRYLGSGERYEPYEPLSFAELMDIAEALKPVQ